MGCVLLFLFYLCAISILVKPLIILELLKDLWYTVVEKFGAKDLYYNKVDSTHFSVQVEVVVNEQFFGWLCGLGRRAVIISPTFVRERYLKHLKKIQEKY